ncbi:pyridoxal phosphate-dependent decarboxylase family protein [Sphingopyxis sp. R3-92]|uniref:pyridoxal phosphate-dependent decarboxylase family protein n=1 Tax=Sphingopyxis sp. R3-92 TaxID=3158553 RepID=UPI003EE73F2F
MEHACRYRDSLGARAPGAAVGPEDLEKLFDGPTPEHPEDGAMVLDALAAAAEAGITSPASSGFFGWVMGGSHPLGVAADMMTSAWGQNVASYACSPAGATAEKIGGRWLLDLLGLPEECSVGFVSGATMAAFTCLAAARGELLRRAGWDVEREGLAGAPRIRTFAGDSVHATDISALRYLGLGSRIGEIATDAQGRMNVESLASELSQHDGPAIVIATAGQINTGAFDRFAEIALVCRKHNAWLHIDGAFGLWAQLLPEKAELLVGVGEADSWSVDGHKWLQLPYDSGFAIVRDRTAHARAMSIQASYLVPAKGVEHDPSQFVPELSRRARGFPLWAMLRALGRQGLANIVRTHCDLARRLAAALSDEAGITIANDVVLNQIILAFGDPANADRCDHQTTAVIGQLRMDGRFLALGADWKGRRVLRISIISPATDAATVDRLAEAIILAWRTVRDAG